MTATTVSKFHQNLSRSVKWCLYNSLHIYRELLLNITLIKQCVKYWRKFSNPSILTIVLGAQKNRLQGDSSREHPLLFSIVNKKTTFNLANWRNYPIHQFQCNYLDFKYHTVRPMCVILEKLSNPSILTIILGTQNNRLQGDGSCEHPWHFSIRK